MERVFVIEGKPKCCNGSKATIKNGRVVIYNPKQEDIQKARWQIMRQVKEKGLSPLTQGAIAIDYTFHMGGAKSRTEGKKEGDLHTSVPDIDNLEKFYSDVVKGLCFVDDKLVALVTKKKVYSKKPYTEIKIRKAEETCT